MLRFILASGLLLLITSGDLCAQRYSGTGLGMKFGYSQNADYASSGANNIALNMPIPSYSVFISNTFRLQKDTARHVFESLKIIVSGNYRGGLFDVNGTTTRITMTFVDFDVILPMRIAISRNLNMQLGFGPNLAFKVKQEANTPTAPAFQPGAIFELGLATMRGSILGFSYSQSFTTYSLSNLSIVFGLAVGDIWNSPKMKRDW
jgi:hypothetical protein